MNIKVASVQYESVFANLNENLKNHIDIINEAKKNNSDLVVFPELSLTGYSLRELVSEVALKENDEIILNLANSSKGVSVIAGFVELGEDNNIYNSAVYCEDGKVLRVCRKSFLPNYGMFEEGRYFANSNEFCVIESNLGNIGLIICEDAWHPEFVLEGAELNLQMLVIISASPVKGTAVKIGNKNKAANENTNKFYNHTLGIPVVFVNKVGYEQGIHFWGGSTTYCATGEILLAAPESESGIYFADVDLRNIKKANINFPFKRDLKNYLY